MHKKRIRNRIIWSVVAVLIVIAGWFSFGPTSTNTKDQKKQLLGQLVKPSKTVSYTHLLKGLDPHDQPNIDATMIALDGTPNKGRLGANAILGVSMATACAAAKDNHQPLYRYLGGTDLEMPQTFHNVINGGEHADNGIDIQEFMITPVAKTSFRDGFEKIVNVYHTLKKVLEDMGYETGLGDEGGFAPNMKNSEEALKALHESIIKAGYKPGEDIAIACDCAASYFYNKEDGKYHLEGKVLTDEELADYYDKLLDEFPELISMEDPYDENDVEGMVKFTESHKDRIQIVLDDFICTNPKLLNKAIHEGAGNASFCLLYTSKCLIWQTYGDILGSI